MRAVVRENRRHHNHRDNRHHRPGPTAQLGVFVVGEARGGGKLATEVPLRRREVVEPAQRGAQLVVHIVALALGGGE